MEEFPWLLIFPGSLFSLTLLSLNFLGDGLRDALDRSGREGLTSRLPAAFARFIPNCAT